MSDPDDKPRRRPPTIDLTATEVEAERTAQAGASEAGASEAEPETDPKPDAPSPDRVRPYAIGAVGGAILVVLIIGGLWSAGLLSPREAAMPAPLAAGPDSSKAIDALSARLAKIESVVATPRGDPALDARLGAAEGQTKSVADALAALNRRLDTVDGAARDARNRADEASAAADAVRRAGQNNVQRSDIDALVNRVAALERSVKTIADEFAKRTAASGDSAARLVVAAEALRTAVERGDPFAPALAAVKALGANANALSALAPFAGSGVPSAASLAQELSALMPAIRQASGMTPNQGGFLDRLEANAERLVRVTPIDAPAGDDQSAVIARTEVDAARADISAAIAEIAKLPANARAAAAPWIEKAEARNAAIAAGRRVASDALAALAKPAPTQSGAQ
jgi:hypothetical protein